MKASTEEWVQKAEDDRAMAKRIASGKKRLYDGVCFHCQQCVEKYLKAILEELGIFVPKTHDLETLLGHLLANYPSLRSLMRGMDFLSQFAVLSRYPGYNAKRRQAQAAVRWMERVRKAARPLLGV